MGIAAVHRIVVVARLLCAAACLFVAQAFQPARGQTREHVTLRLDWWPGAYHLPIFLASARGYYAAAGIDLDIRDGKGSQATIQAVAGGSDLIGIASLSIMTIAVGKGLPLIAIAGIVQKSPDSVIALQGSGIVRPKDVEGKRWGNVPDSSPSRSFAAFAAANGVDLDTITRVQLNSTTMYAALLQGHVDFVTAWASNDALKIARVKPIEPPIIFADHGVNTLGVGFIVTRDTAAQRGELLRRFLAATARGLREVDADPAAAIDAMLQARPMLDRAVITGEVPLVAAFRHTANSEGHPFGWMAQADWEQTRDLLTKYFGLTGNIDVSSLYTNAFLPDR